MRRRWYVLWISLAVTGFLVLVGWRTFRKDAGKKIEYQTAAIERGDIVAKVTATGTLSPLKMVQVGSQVSGRIQELLADYNSTVTRGQVIARIDPQLVNAAVERSRANLAAARADQVRAKALALDSTRQAERAKSLFAQKLISQAEADTAVSNAEAMNAQVVAAGGSVKQASAALSEAELNLTYTTIYSPIDGMVISRNVDVGQTVAASFQAPTLFTIAEDLRKMQVNTSVSESDVGKLAAGQNVVFTVDAYPNKKFNGVVRQVRNAPTTVQNVVTYDAVIDVENPSLQLKPGMTANVSFTIGNREKVLRLPSAALRFRPPPDVLGAARKEQEKFSKQSPLSAPTSNRETSAENREKSPPEPERASDATPGRVDELKAEEKAEGKSTRRRSGDDDVEEKTVWKLQDGKLVPLKLRLGLSDGVAVEILGGEAKEGDLIVVGGGDAPPAGQSQQRPGGGGRMRGPF